MGAKRAFNLTWLTLGKQLDQAPKLPSRPSSSSASPQRIDRNRATSVRQCDDQVKHATTASGTQTHQINESGRCATLCTSLIPGWGRPYSSCDHLPSCASKAKWSWSWTQSQCRTLVALLKAFSFHSLYFASFGSCEFMKMKIAKKLENSSSWSYSHCFFSFAFLSFCFLCSAHFVARCTVAYWAMAACRRPQHRTTDPDVAATATALGSLNICMLDLMWIQLAYQLQNSRKQNKPSSQELVV